MSEIIEIQLDDFKRLLEENENLQKLIKEKNETILFLEKKINNYEKKF